MLWLPLTGTVPCVRCGGCNGNGYGLLQGNCHGAATVAPHGKPTADGSGPGVGGPLSLAAQHVCTGDAPPSAEDGSLWNEDGPQHGSVHPLQPEDTHFAAMVCRGIAAMVWEEDRAVATLTGLTPPDLQRHYATLARAIGAVQSGKALGTGMLLCPPLSIHRGVQALLWLVQQPAWTSRSPRQQGSGG